MRNLFLVIGVLVMTSIFAHPTPVQASACDGYPTVDLDVGDTETFQIQHPSQNYSLIWTGPGGGPHEACVRVYDVQSGNDLRTALVICADDQQGTRLKDHAGNNNGLITLELKCVQT